MMGSTTQLCASKACSCVFQHRAGCPWTLAACSNAEHRREPVPCGGWVPPTPPHSLATPSHPCTDAGIHCTTQPKSAAHWSAAHQSTAHSSPGPTTLGPTSSFVVTDDTAPKTTSANASIAPPPPSAGRRDLRRKQICCWQVAGGSSAGVREGGRRDLRGTRPRTSAPAASPGAGRSDRRGWSAAAAVEPAGRQHRRSVQPGFWNNYVQ
eukprot:COSAG01_NODE_23398_length_816_cov_8.389121_2_plen_209_part_00